MKLRNRSREAVKRQINGGWLVIKPGDTVVLEQSEAMYLLTAERHLWEDAAEPMVPEPTESPPDPDTKPEKTPAKTNRKKGGE